MASSLLNFEVVQSILSHLKPKDLCRCTAVCREWRRAVLSNKALSNVIASHRRIELKKKRKITETSSVLNQDANKFFSTTSRMQFGKVIPTSISYTASAEETLTRSGTNVNAIPQEVVGLTLQDYNCKISEIIFQSGLQFNCNARPLKRHATSIAGNNESKKRLRRL